MTTYVLRNGKMVDKRFAEPSITQNAACYVISDEMPATRHMADNKRYTSKAKFRQATKDAGCIEIGTDKSILEPRKPILLDRAKRREDIKRTIYELRNGIRR